MHKSPLVLGIDEKIFRDYRTSRKFIATGSNTGNIIFSEALFNCIGGGVRSNYAFSPDDIEGRDAIVVTAANWVDPASEFTDLLNRLEATNLPIYTIGLGAQADNAQTRPQLKPDQDRLIRLLADRCTTLSVRGEYTAEVLSDLGIKNVDVTGCPSLLLMGEGPKIKASNSLEKITLHGTRHGFTNGLPEQDALYQIAIKNNYDIVLQSELAELLLADNRNDEPDMLIRAYKSISTLYPGKPLNEIESFLENHAKYFFNLSDWIEYSATRDFFLGTRIHGTIAALLGGTRAMLLTHDARTEELAKALNIPHMPLAEFNTEDDSGFTSLFEMSSPTALQDGYRQYRVTFEAFMARNSLSLKAPDLIGNAYRS